MRELARGGQVYYVYNRVNGIDQKSAGIVRACAGCFSGLCPWTNSEHSWRKLCISLLTGDRVCLNHD